MKANKTVFITGSSKGIGKAIAEKFAKEQYNVVLNCKSSTDEMNKIINNLKKINPNIIGIQADVGNYQEAEKAFNKIYSVFDNIDVLVNNAGISYIGTFNTMSPNQWEEIINTNLKSAINCSYLALQYMIKNHKGNIINISSMWGVCGASCEVIYSATKGGLNTFTKALAKEVAPSGIRVNALSCGVIDTDMNSFLDKEEKENLTEEIPLCRFGSPKEVADAVYYLAGENSSYITGQILGVDGGMI